MVWIRCPHAGAACWTITAFASAFATAQEKSLSPEHPAHPKLAAVADRIIENFMQEKHVPGLVLAAVRDGDIVVEKGYGVLSPNDKRRPDSDTLFYIGSLSKAITAMGIELLAEQGKLNINEPAARHLKGLPKLWRRIPLKLFLAHQSGIPRSPLRDSRHSSGCFARLTISHCRSSQGPSRNTIILTSPLQAK